MKLIVSFVRIAAVFCVYSATSPSASAGETTTNGMATGPAIPADMFLELKLRGAPSAEKTPRFSRIAESSASESSDGDRPAVCNHFVFSFNLTGFMSARSKAGALRPPSQSSVSFAGCKLKTTQGAVPVVTDPLDTAEAKYLRAETYTRVECSSDCKGFCGSEAEGFGHHISAISPDAAVFVKAQGKGVNVSFSMSSDRVFAIPSFLWHH